VALTALLAAPLMAGRSLYVHVARVAAPLAAGDIDGARGAVAMIVGRDPAALDTAGIARAALESLGENASDGVIAPLFWGVVGGLPGLILYKGINTMDSMIGYRDARYEDFGKAAARLDDLANWLPARLTALGFALVSGRPRRVMALARAEAGQHRSPNAGWPETALAGALGCRLSGPRVYGDRHEAHPWINGACPDPDAATLRAGLGVFVRMTVLLAAAALLAGGVA
jgi:adenosylcobinamide-phosphate synthase